MPRPILYTYYLSSCSWRVRIALVYKGIEYETRTVTLPKGESEFLKINPIGQIPVLVVNGTPLVDSMAIMEYLEEKHPERPLMPIDLFKRAKVRQICEIISTGIQPLQNPAVAAKHSDDPVKRSEWQQFYINKGFRGLEAVISESSGQYCVGDDFSFADICLIPQLFNAETRFNIDLTPYPRMTKIYRRLLELDVVNSTHPRTQPGAPQKL